MLVIPFGILISLKAQFVKALFPTLVKLLGHFISANLLQFLNAYSPISLIESGNSIFSKLLQLLNAESPISFIVSGITILFNRSQFSK